MEREYKSFQNLPKKVAEKLRKRIVESEGKYNPDILEDSSSEGPDHFGCSLRAKP